MNKLKLCCHAFKWIFHLVLEQISKLINFENSANPEIPELGMGKRTSCGRVGLSTGCDVKKKKKEKENYLMLLNLSVANSRFSMPYITAKGRRVPSFLM